MCPWMRSLRDLRRRAKGVNFGIVYGITDFGLARDIGVSREEAAIYIDNYFNRYPGVRRFINETITAAREQGWVETLFKRRRYLPDLLSSNRQIRAFGERTAVNTPMQGTAADIIKLAMLHIDQALREQGLRARMLLQVHDELVFEFPKQEQPVLIDLVRAGMEQAVQLDVPLDVEIKMARIGTTWRRWRAMPELPEVQTVLNTLQTRVMGLRIDRVEAFLPKIIKTPGPQEFMALLKGRTITGLGGAASICSWNWMSRIC